MAKDTFHKGQFYRGHGLDLPPEIEADLQKRGWAHRWLNSNNLTASGGHDSRGWMAYRIPDSLRVESKPGEYVEGSDFKQSIDGFYRRGDMILGVMPKARQQLLRQESQERTKRQENVTANVKARSRNVSVRESTKEKVAMPSRKDILED